MLAAVSQSTATAEKEKARKRSLRALHFKGRKRPLIVA